MPVFGGENADSYYDEGITASMKGDLPRAIDYFEKTIRLDNSYGAAYHQLGKVYARMGKFKKSIAFLSQVTASKPGQIPPKIDLAYAHLGEGNTSQARDLFYEVTALKPQHVRGRMGVAYCAFAEENYDEAIILLQDIIEGGGATFGTYYLMARAASVGMRPDMLHDSIERADALIEKTLETNDENPGGYYLRGLLLELSKDDEKAEENFALAVERAEPDHHYSAYEEHFSLEDMLGHLAQTRQRQGNAQAAEDFDRLRELNPESPYLDTGE